MSKAQFTVTYDGPALREGRTGGMVWEKIVSRFPLALFGASAALSVLLSSASAEAWECDALKDAVIKATGATFDKMSPLGTSYFLAHPAVDDLSVNCAAKGRSTGISGGWHTADPPRHFYMTLALAGGELANGPASKVETTIRACLQKAILDKGKTAEVESGTLRFECQAYRRDGEGVQVSIFDR